MRFNGFLMVHKALRAMLFENALELQRTDYRDYHSMEPILRQLLHIALTYEYHADKEDHFILPLAAEFDQPLMKAFEDEHEADRALGTELKESIENYLENKNPSKSFELGSKVFYTLMSFIAFNLNHMNKEENEFNQVVWNHYSDEEIMAANGRVEMSLTDEQKKFGTPWFMKSNTASDIIEWMGKVRKVAPAPVFEGMAGLAKQLITDKRWETIASELQL